MALKRHWIEDWDEEDQFRWCFGGKGSIPPPQKSEDPPESDSEDVVAANEEARTKNAQRAAAAENLEGAGEQKLGTAPTKKPKAKSQVMTGQSEGGSAYT
jgi:hypothetical protein